MDLGLDHLAAYLQRHAAGARVGLLCHAASVTSDSRHAIEVITRSRATLRILLGPEHGVSSTAVDMERVDASTHPTVGIPIYSLYGNSVASLSPRPEWLSELDLLVVDLQDIGTRYYTYVNTMANSLQVCSTLDLPVVVCDRPNPIDGLTVEGPLVEPGFHSFVGQYPISARHGMTIGELAQYIRHREGWRSPLTVLRMEGWQRHWYWDDTGLTWHNPSPNMRSLAAAVLYPGVCLLEATNISEGRGTESPFEQCGAPWIDGQRLAATLHSFAVDGIAVVPTQFTPTVRKFAGQRCHGVHLTITDRQRLRPYEFGLALLWALATQDRAAFQWRTPAGNPPHSGLDAGPYEFVTDRPAIDLLTGRDTVRQTIDGGATWEEIRQLSPPPPASFLADRRDALLY